MVENTSFACFAALALASNLGLRSTLTNLEEGLRLSVARAQICKLVDGRQAVMETFQKVRDDLAGLANRDRLAELYHAAMGGEVERLRNILTDLLAQKKEAEVTADEVLDFLRTEWQRQAT